MVVVNSLIKWSMLDVHCPLSHCTLPLMLHRIDNCENITFSWFGFLLAKIPIWCVKYLIPLERPSFFVEKPEKKAWPLKISIIGTRSPSSTSAISTRTSRQHSMGRRTDLWVTLRSMDRGVRIGRVNSMSTQQRISELLISALVRCVNLFYKNAKIGRLNENVGSYWRGNFWVLLRINYTECIFHELWNI